MSNIISQSSNTNLQIKEKSCKSENENSLSKVREIIELLNSSDASDKIGRSDLNDILGSLSITPWDSIQLS